MASFAICWRSSCIATIWATVTCDLAWSACSSVRNFCKSAWSCGLGLFGGCGVEATGAGVFGVVDEDVVVLTGAVVDAPEAVAGVVVGVAAVVVVGGVVVGGVVVGGVVVGGVVVGGVVVGGVVVGGVVVGGVDVGVVDADVEVEVVAEACEFTKCEARLPCIPNPCRLPC